jgi:hypothetical protein
LGVESIAVAPMVGFGVYNPLLPYKVESSVTAGGVIADLPLSPAAQLPFDAAPAPPSRVTVRKATGDAAEWVKRNLGIVPDAKQARVLSTEIHRGILNCTRQWGKSTISAAKAVHQAVSEAGSLTVVVSPSARQSGEFVRKAGGVRPAAGHEDQGRWR